MSYVLFYCQKKARIEGISLDVSISGKTLPDNLITEKEAILGNGDSRQKFQTFKLPKELITYLDSAGEIPSGLSGLQIYVNGRLWTRVPSFSGREPREEIYTIRQDENGDICVQFGDGKTGARLPSGKKNVVAKYRTGIGVSRPNRISKLSQPGKFLIVPLVKTEKHAFKVSSKFSDRDIFKFSVNTTGKISVKASWTGNAPQLALILNDPSRAESVRKDGKSPSVLTFVVTEKMLQKGTGWKVSIVNISRKGSAKGKVWISYPAKKE